LEVKVLLAGGDTNPVRTSAMQHPEVNKMYSPFYDVLMAGFGHQYYTWPLFPEWPQIINIMNNRIMAMAGGEPIKSTLDEATGECRKILTEAGYYK
jgi:hypothetical protein